MGDNNDKIQTDEIKFIDFDDKYKEDLVDIIFDAYQDHPEYGEPSPKHAKKYINWLKNHSTMFKIAIQDDKPVGFIVVDTNWKDKFDDNRQVGEIHELAVKKQFWGKGVGSRLLNEALKHIKEKGLDTARLWVGEKNEEAKAFYKKRGFKPLFQGWGWLRMEKRL